MQAAEIIIISAIILSICALALGWAALRVYKFHKSACEMEKRALKAIELTKQAIEAIRGLPKNADLPS